MRMLDCSPFDQCFTHVAHDGTVRHFNPDELVRRVVDGRAKPTIINMGLDATLMDIIENHHGIEEAHIARIKAGKARHSAPALVVELDDGSCILIDGNHRCVVAWRDGKDAIEAAVFKPHDWKPCLIEDLPMTEAELVALGLVGEPK